MPSDNQALCTHTLESTSLRWANGEDSDDNEDYDNHDDDENHKKSFLQEESAMLMYRKYTNTKIKHFESLSKILHTSMKMNLSTNAGETKTSW